MGECVTELILTTLFVSASIGSYLALGLHPAFTHSTIWIIDPLIYLIATTALYVIFRVAFFIIGLPIKAIIKLPHIKRLFGLLFCLILGCAGLYLARKSPSAKSVNKYLKITLGKKWTDIVMHQLPAVQRDLFFILRLTVGIVILQIGLGVLIAPLQALSKISQLGKKRYKMNTKEVDINEESKATLSKKLQ